MNPPKRLSLLAACGLSAASIASAADDTHTLANPFRNLLPEQLIRADGREVPRDALAGKYVGFYFSAHWCPPCKVFTPKLVKFRDRNAQNFEVVFVSSDRSLEEQKRYMTEADMKWPAVPRDRPEGSRIASEFGVRFIPTLIVLSPEGEIVTRDGRSDVEANFDGALEAWMSGTED